MAGTAGGPDESEASRMDWKSSTETPEDSTRERFELR
jgi:hypothetical protein